MRIASRVLGIPGRVFGVIAGILALFVGGIGAEFEVEESVIVIFLAPGWNFVLVDAALSFFVSQSSRH
ncbi:MAG: hypothetical protein ACFB50_08820 [Rubrobacteraceae bacterium]